MKTAIILTGQCRTFARCLPSLHWQVFSKFENPYFFASVANDEDAGSIELLRQQYPDAPIFIEKVDQPVLPEPPLVHTLHAPYAITPTRTPGVGPLQGIMRQLWHLSRGWRFACEHGADKCDVFVRSRMDLHFHRFKAMVGEQHADDFAYVPYWGHYGPGTNDRFAIMGRDAAQAYFQTYDKLPDMLAAGIPFHPETMVGASLERAGCSISRTLCAEFSMRRKPTLQYPDGELVHMQVLPGEFCEYAAYLSKQ